MLCNTLKAFSIHNMKIPAGILGWNSSLIWNRKILAVAVLEIIFRWLWSHLVQDQKSMSCYQVRSISYVPKYGPSINTSHLIIVKTVYTWKHLSHLDKIIKHQTRVTIINLFFIKLLGTKLFAFWQIYIVLFNCKVIFKPRVKCQLPVCPMSNSYCIPRLRWVLVRI